MVLISLCVSDIVFTQKFDCFTAPRDHGLMWVFDINDRQTVRQSSDPIRVAFSF